MDIPKHNGPWKGLASYEEGEILYGRDIEIEHLAQFIFNNKQTVVYGRTGIGKSSILNAGILPKSRQNNMTPIVIRLKHNSTSTYIEQIRQAFLDNDIMLWERKLPVNKDSETLWEFIHRHIFLSQETRTETIPLIIFDQFEEIFSLQSNDTVRREFFNNLADLLNDVKPLYLIDKEISETDNQLKITKTVTNGAYKGASLSLNLRKTTSNNATLYADEYTVAPAFHMVFVLREDFLSTFEIQTQDIAALKNKRFPILPINEEQAADIIMKPCPGLVSSDVARLIIEKVSGRTDFVLDGIPEIEIDSAILSLFLSRLYEKMISVGDTIISSELVNEYSENILYDYYIEAIASLSEVSVNWIETVLVNEDGRRDNRSYSSVLKESGLNADNLYRLINQTKILRQFSYDGSIRVELVHDVLCPIIMKHRHQRDEEKEIMELELRSKRNKKRLLIRTSVLTSIIVLLLIGSFIFVPRWMLKHHENTTITVSISNLMLNNDNTNPNDCITLKVLGISKNAGDTILLVEDNVTNGGVTSIPLDKQKFKDIRFEIDIASDNATMPNKQYFDINTNNNLLMSTSLKFIIQQNTTINIADNEDIISQFVPLR